MTDDVSEGRGHWRRGELGGEVGVGRVAGEQMGRDDPNNIDH